ncbi:MAG: UDP-N-acetylmuramoyl-L-alanine--D-glutamate ligase [Thermodesulfobacteriota bacterium]
MELAPGMKCVVIGLGASGLAAVRFLREQGLRVSVSEARPAESLAANDLTLLGELGVDWEAGGHRAEFFREAELIVPSPGVPLDLPVLRAARERGATIAGELAIAAGYLRAPVIAITGSNGKTTVTSLIGHLLRSAGRETFVGGNIGTPVLEYLRGSRPAEAIVLELSSFQLEIGGAFRPDIALLLNLTPDHLDRHGGMAGYVAAKRRIFVNQKAGDWAILGGDDPLVMAEEVATGATVFRFGATPGCEARVNEQGVLLSLEIGGRKIEEEYDLQATTLASIINRLNAAAAILAVRVFGCAPEAIRAGMADYEPPAHRMALVAERDGVRYVDDSKGTNIGAVAAALASSGKRVILIAGGRNKGSDFRPLAESVRRHVRHLILIGEAAAQMAAELGSLVPTSRAASMREAVRQASEIAEPGDTVLLSPACASFDMFTSYAHRGEVFRQAVRELAAVHHGG